MLNVLVQQGMGTNMLYALKNLYTNTNVILDIIGTFKSISDIRQGAVYME